MPHDLDRAIAEALTAQGLDEDLARESFVSCPDGHQEHDLKP